MICIIKTDTKNRYFKFLKIVKFEGLKNYLKNTLNDIVYTKHVLYACTVSYISLKVYKYCYPHKIP